MEHLWRLFIMQQAVVGFLFAFQLEIATIVRGGWYHRWLGSWNEGSYFVDEELFMWWRKCILCKLYSHGFGISAVPQALQSACISNGSRRKNPVIRTPWASAYGRTEYNKSYSIGWLPPELASSMSSIGTEASLFSLSCAPCSTRVTHLNELKIRLHPLSPCRDDASWR